MTYLLVRRLLNFLSAAVEQGGIRRCKRLFPAVSSSSPAVFRTGFSTPGSLKLLEPTLIRALVKWRAPTSFLVSLTELPLSRSLSRLFSLVAETISSLTGGTAEIYYTKFSFSIQTVSTLLWTTLKLVDQPNKRKPLFSPSLNNVETSNLHYFSFVFKIRLKRRKWIFQLSAR